MQLLFRESIANNTCFICGVERTTFFQQLADLNDSSKGDGKGGDAGGDADGDVERVASSASFLTHRNKTHNAINYFYFIVSIWEQNWSDDSG